MTPLRVLFVSDTHLGFDLPSRPQVDRRRRGADFFACFERALEPALRGEADVVVHGGDLLYRSRVKASLVERALAPLRRVADAGVPVVIVPGNHERSAIPYPLLAAHPRLHVLRGPTTVVLEAPRSGVRAAFAGFPYAHGVRAAFPALLKATGYQKVEADVRVLCLHHCIEGAVCGPPPGHTFRDGEDVCAPPTCPATSRSLHCGHNHRHQVLRADLGGRALPAPVVYAGSVERTSFAERDETKGFVTLGLGRGGRGGRLLECAFHPLPARPMRVHEVEHGSHPARLEPLVRAAIAAAPADVVLQLRVPGFSSSCFTASSSSRSPVRSATTPSRHGGSCPGPQRTSAATASRTAGQARLVGSTSSKWPAPSTTSSPTRSPAFVAAAW